MTARGHRKRGDRPRGKRDVTKKTEEEKAAFAQWEVDRNEAHRLWRKTQRTSNRLLEALWETNYREAHPRPEDQLKVAQKLWLLEKNAAEHEYLEACDLAGGDTGPEVMKAWREKYEKEHPKP